jgi:four helix bundle protein
MAKIVRFEDMKAWQRARELTAQIYVACRLGALAKDFGLRNQMRRSAVSICSNLAEGFARGGDREFIPFLSQAKGSCGELRWQLHHAWDVGHLSQDEFDSLRISTEEISAMFSSLMSHLKSSELKGRKFAS